MNPNKIYYQLKTIVLIVLLFWVAIIDVGAQNIENIVRSKPVKITGRLGLGTTFITSDKANYQDKLGYYINGGINIQLFESFSIPISFRYSDQQSTFDRPTFKMLGFSPAYKWITVHGGYRSFNLGKYQMAGTNILGGGLDLRPGIFRLTVFYGNLAGQYDFGYNHPEFSGKGIDFYKRKMYGGKIGFERGSNYLFLSYLKAKDHMNEDHRILDSLSIKPKENAVLGLKAGFGLFRGFTISGEISASVLNEDTQANPREVEPGFVALSKWTIPINESTRNYFAYNTRANLRIKRTNFGLEYEHIDPNYNSLGINYLQSDVDNYTFFINTSIAKSSLNLSGRIGWQFTDTKNYFKNAEKRVIYNLSAQYKPSRQIQISTTYNNFNTNNNATLTEFLDSLYISTQNTGLSGQVRISPGGKQTKGQIILSATHNKFLLVRGKNQLSENLSTNYSLGYSNKVKSSDLTYGASINYQTFENSHSVKRMGGSFKIGKKIGKKWSTRGRASYHINVTDGFSDGGVVQIRGALTYKFFSKGSVRSYAMYRYRNTKRLDSFSTLSYGINCQMNF